MTSAAVVLLVFGTLAAFGSAMTLLWSLFAMRWFGMWFDGGVMVPRMDPVTGGHMGFDGGSMGWAGFASFGLMLLVGVAISGGHLAAGWAILQRLEWGRILGMVVSGVALVVLVLGVAGMLVWWSAIPDFSAFDGQSGYWVDWYRSMLSSAVAFGAVVSLAVGLLYGFVLWTLARAGDVFD